VYLDSDQGPTDVLPDFPPPAGDGTPDWAHLAMVYDAGAGKVRLYVDGEPATLRGGSGQVAEIDYVFGWASDGPLRIGRGQTGGAFAGDVGGKVDDVITFDAALTTAQIRRLSTTNFRSELDVSAVRDAFAVEGLAARWQLDEADGATAYDSSGNGHHLALSEEVTWCDWVSGSGFNFAGDLDAVAETYGPVIDTAESYSFSAWVRLDDKSQLQNIMGPAGDGRMGFYLRYRQASDQWQFMLGERDDRDEHEDHEEHRQRGDLGHLSELAVVQDHDRERLAPRPVQQTGHGELVEGEEEGDAGRRTDQHAFERMLPDQKFGFRSQFIQFLLNLDLFEQLTSFIDHVLQVFIDIVEGFLVHVAVMWLVMWESNDNT
jgi:hypothetical protein